MVSRPLKCSVNVSLNAFFWANGMRCTNEILQFDQIQISIRFICYESHATSVVAFFLQNGEMNRIKNTAKTYPMAQVKRATSERLNVQHHSSIAHKKREKRKICMIIEIKPEMKIRLIMLNV